MKNSSNFRKIPQRRLEQSQRFALAEAINEAAEDGAEFRPWSPSEETEVASEIYWYNDPSTLHFIGRGILCPQLVHYIINDEGREEDIPNVGVAWKRMRAQMKAPDYWFNKETYIPAISSAAMIWWDENRMGQWLKAWGYDMNKCYLSLLSDPMPDVYGVEREAEVWEGSVGFYFNGKKTVSRTGEVRQLLSTTTERGAWCDFVCPLTESPFREYARHMIDLIESGTEAGDKARVRTLKREVVCCVGNMQKANPLLRAAIVGAANNRMNLLIDENTVYCNTDCIVSTKERIDLPISQHVGDFKIENVGEFMYTGANYEWRGGKKAQRGPQGNPKTMYFDFKKRRIVVLK